MSKYVFHSEPFIFEVGPERIKFIGGTSPWILYTPSAFADVKNAYESHQYDATPIQEYKSVEVLSNSNPGKRYTIRRYNDGHYTCECKAFEFRQKCRHIDDMKARGTLE
jgi:hypothetical protein